MSQLLEHTRTRRPFARRDILSQFGETICLPVVEVPAPMRRSVPVVQPAIIPTSERAIDEDPERWDGLS